MKRNWLRKIIGGLSFTSALFVFQACYGTEPDFGHDFLLEGQVTSKISGAPISGIRVSVPFYGQFQLTDEAGNFSFYTGMRDNLTINFEDVDLLENGSFRNRDTVLSNYDEKIYLLIEMEEK